MVPGKELAAVAIFQRTGKPDAAIYRTSSEGEGKTHQKQMDDGGDSCEGLGGAVHVGQGVERHG